MLSFDEFCNNTDLNYYLSGGTLLDAVRHKVFIPWDDDIDVCMPRNDFEKLKGICSNASSILKIYGYMVVNFESLDKVALKIS